MSLALATYLFALGLLVGRVTYSDDPVPRWYLCALALIGVVLMGKWVA